MITSQLPGESRADWVARDLYAILEYDVTYQGWEHETAENKAFYVRGFTWFRDNVINGHMNITDAGKFIPQMKSTVSGRSAWSTLPFKWTEPFGDRQFIDTASPQRKLTPKFQKGVEVIALCEAIADSIATADASRPSGKDVYEHMRLEPAVSFYSCVRSQLDKQAGKPKERFFA